MLLSNATTLLGLAGERKVGKVGGRAHFGGLRSTDMLIVGGRIRRDEGVRKEGYDEERMNAGGWEDGMAIVGEMGWYVRGFYRRSE